MKNLLLISSLSLFAVSCIPDKDKRQERKDDHSAEHMRNEGVDSTLLSTDAQKADTTAVKKDSAK